MGRLSPDEERDVAFWGHVLRRWPRDVVDKMGLSTGDGVYLADVGLPVGIAWNINLVIDPPRIGSSPQLCDGSPVLAHIDKAPIVVDAHDGMVWIGKAPYRRALVNTNVRYWGHFLRIFQDLRIRGLQLADSGLPGDSLINEAYDEMNALDPKALHSDETYWSLVMWETRHGLV
jgi:SUKH-4 immunity protein